MTWLVTGAAGFIGTNLVTHLLETGHDVIAVDDLSRPGSERNYELLKDKYSLTLHKFDISSPSATDALREICPEPTAVAHLAGQVSFMASLQSPRRDFEVNALGSLNVLEYIRLFCPETPVIGMSSNKVYGDIATLTYEETATRFTAIEFPEGFDETLPLDFRGPYGCSKGTADQYFVDYGRMFGLRTASFRQSSVYGPHQHPQSDQGWVAHLVESAIQGQTIQLNGIGKQVRDLLHATDLARLITKLAEDLPAGGVAANVGGGNENSLSILELFNMLEEWSGSTVDFRTGASRPSDQRVFISRNSTISRLTGWVPTIKVTEGVLELYERSLKASF